MTAQRGFALAIAVIGWCALAAQTWLTTSTAVHNGMTVWFGLLKAASYFTILTNLLVAVVATHAAARVAVRPGFFSRSSTMSATAVYIAVVGIIYSLLLRALWEPTGLALAADEALHDVIPVLYLLYWLACVPKGLLRWSMPVAWLVYPLGYAAWALVRGALTGDYPYHFADPTQLGYAKVAVNTAGVLAAFYVLGLILVGIDHLFVRARVRRAA